MALKLTDKENLIDNVWAFRFESSQPFTWVPGQFIRVELPHEQSDDEGTKRWFTISSAPYEKIIQITTRVTGSTFKQALAKLVVGDELQLLDQPDGDFVWRDTTLPIIFIAGGIGVTPFYSILKQRVNDNLSLNVSLVYGSRSDAVPFKEELDAWSKKDGRLQVHYVVDSPLTAVSLAELLPDINASLVYLSGPEPMVEALGEELVKQGLPAEQLKQDYFPNYTESNY